MSNNPLIQVMRKDGRKLKDKIRKKNSERIGLKRNEKKRDSVLVWLMKPGKLEKKRNKQGERRKNKKEKKMRHLTV